MTILAEGADAPEFYACSPDMKAVTNAAFAGKTVILSFFPAAFSGGPEDGCEMQLCGMSHVASTADKEKFVFYGVSGDLPFANKAFGKKLDLCFPLLSDPSMETCERYVGKCGLGAFLKEHGITDALDGAITSARGCVVIDPAGKVLYAFSGHDHPGRQPDMAAIRKIVS